MDNIVEFQVEGKYALFTDPLTRVGGEKFSYQVPTYEGLKGILSSVYWKPTIIWIIDRVRIVNAIQTQARNVRPIKYGGGNDLAIYTYLKDVVYQVEAHFEWNPHRDDLKEDRNENKHYFIAKRMIDRGGRRDVFLGTRECQAYVTPCVFGEGKGFYDDYPGEISFGVMFHGFDYPDESGESALVSCFWHATMQAGVIRFLRPDDQSLIRKEVRPMQANPPQSIGLNEPSLVECLREQEG